MVLDLKERKFLSDNREFLYALGICPGFLRSYKMRNNKAVHGIETLLKHGFFPRILNSTKKILVKNTVLIIYNVYIFVNHF